MSHQLKHAMQFGKNTQLTRLPFIIRIEYILIAMHRSMFNSGPANIHIADTPKTLLLFIKVLSIFAWKYVDTVSPHILRLKPSISVIITAHYWWWFFDFPIISKFDHFHTFIYCRRIEFYNLLQTENSNRTSSTSTNKFPLQWQKIRELNGTYE